MPAFKSHHTATVDKPWDGGAAEKKAKSGEKQEYYGRIYGWYDSKGKEGVKATYKFPHHEVAADGTPGPANTNACSSAIGVLNGGMGGADIPAADRSGVHAHMAAHLKDAKKEVPPLKGSAAEDYPLVFSSFQDQLWAILPGKLEEITALVEKFLSGDRPEFPEAALRRTAPGGEEPPYQMMGQGVAMLPVMGTLGKRMNLFSQMSGGTSYDKIGQALKAALADPNVAAILLNIDSPGGTVDGAKTLADQIYAARQQKPIVAHSDGQMASAAYWLGSAADQLMISDTAMVGSIGVAGTHFDRSGQDAQAGIKRTIIASGKYKRIASDAEPLSPAGQDYLQQISDTYYNLFLQDIGRHRGLNAERVHAQMADGRTFIGQQALDAGLVDKIGTLEAAAALAADMAQVKKMGKPQGGFSMDKQTLQAQHPEVFAEVLNAGEAQERTRVVKILRAGGKPEIVLEAIEKGLTAEAALDNLLKIERQDRETAEAETAAIKAKAAAALEDEATKAQGQGTGDGETFETKVAALVAGGKTRSEAIKEVVRDFPELHQAYLGQANPKKQ
jgi:signal peptide peptidase SppA